MFEFKKIVVGLELAADGRSITLGSLKAASQAIWVARVGGGGIHYVHSTFEDCYVDAEKGPIPLARQSLSDGGRTALEAQVEATRSEGVPAELELTEGRVWLDIVRMALRREADLVVVGKRGESVADGRKLGSVATKLLRKCPCPVWVVKPEHDLVQRLVLAASDLTPVGDQACRAAAHVARLHGCDLHVVHAYQVPYPLQLDAARISEVEYAERIESLRARAAGHIRACVADIAPDEGRRVEVHVGKGVPSTVIREAVAHLDPDLLVMGTISRGGLAGLLVGSTAERLLDRLDCSFLGVKPADFVCPVEA